MPIKLMTKDLLSGIKRLFGLKVKGSPCCVVFATKLESCWVRTLLMWQFIIRSLITLVERK